MNSAEGFKLMNNNNNNNNNNISEAVNITSPDFNDYLRKNAIRISAYIITALILFFLVIYLIITNYPNVLRYDLHVFQSDGKHAGIINAHSANGEVGKELTAKIENAYISNGKIYITVSGRNTIDREQILNGQTFAVSSFNTSYYEARYHFYPDNFEKVAVKPNESYKINLCFTVTDLSEKLSPEYIYSLSLFRKDRQKTVEIIIDNLV